MKRPLLSIFLLITTLFSMAQPCDLGVVNMPYDQCIPYGGTWTFSVVPGTTVFPAGGSVGFYFDPVPGLASGGGFPWIPDPEQFSMGYEDSLPASLVFDNGLNGYIDALGGEPMFGEWFVHVYINYDPSNLPEFDCDSLIMPMHLNFLQQGDTSCASAMNNPFWISPVVFPTNLGCNGSVYVNVLGGTPPYGFTFSTGQMGSSNELMWLCEGVYSVAVEDANGINGSATFVIADSSNVYSDPIIQNLFDPDTAFTNAIQNCTMDYNAPIDSFHIGTASMYGTDTLFAEWVIWQGGEPFTVAGFYPFFPNGQPVLALTLYCMNGRAAFGSFQLYAALPANVGIRETERAKVLQVYPNPNTGLCSIRFNGPQTGQLTVRDAVGKRVMQYGFTNSVHEHLDLTGLSAGMYLLEARTHDGQVYQAKVVKE